MGGMVARINIEDSLLKDDKFTDLCIKLGSRIYALGVITEAYILAQKFYLNETTQRLIPLSEWTRKKELHVLLDVFLAEHKADGIYVKGSNESFAWLIQKQNAGKSSAASKRIKAEMGSTPVDGRTTAANGSQPLTLTPTLSLNSVKETVLNNNNIGTEKIPTQSANAVDVVVEKASNTQLIRITANKEIKIKQELLNSWQDQYPKEFLEQSLKDMRSWLLANDHKAPKSAWGKFMNSWFARGWERYRTTLKSEPKKTTFEEFEEIMKRDLFA